MSVGCAKPIGETAIGPGRVQPSAEIVRVGCAKRNCDCAGACAGMSPEDLIVYQELLKKL